MRPPYPCSPCEQSRRAGGANAPQRGFTLIEVLVVVAILGMLVGLLMPSLSRARQQARELQCLNRLRGVYMAHVTYTNEHGAFPALNNDPDDGAWQYNYLIYDERDFEENFGPLVFGGETVDEVELLFCPVQTDPFHRLSTTDNPWPAVPGVDTRASYGRRYHLTGRSFSQLRRMTAFVADVFHLPKVVQSGHGRGVNAIYSDGHAHWVENPGIFTHNGLSHPFDPLDNEIIEDIWDAMDEAK